MFAFSVVFDTLLPGQTLGARGYWALLEHNLYCNRKTKYWEPKLDCCKSTWDTVPYFGVNDLSMILCLWSPLYPLSELRAIQGHAQNLEEQLWMERRRGVGIISYRPVSSSDLKQERSFFRRSVWTLIFFATGCSFLSQNLEVLEVKLLCTVKIVLLLHFSCDFSLWKFAFPRGQGGYHSAIVTIGRSLWQYERSSGSP